MKPMLVLRPEPGASATARRIASLGGRAIVAPLFTVAPIVWTLPPPERFDALMLTSANAVREAGDGLAVYRALPVYAVGAMTAAALRDADIEPARVGGGDAADLLAAIEADGYRSILHLTGEAYRAVVPETATITHLPVYRASAVQDLPETAIAAIGEGAVALLHSPRAARLFAGLVDPAGRAIAAISLATAEAAGLGWRAVAIAAQPTDDALLAAAARLCEG
jgi:uroporphyrinogen-III synthase